jgi:hypothetical protein
MIATHHHVDGYAQAVQAERIAGVHADSRRDPARPLPVRPSPRPASIRRPAR